MEIFTLYCLAIVLVFMYDLFYVILKHKDYLRVLCSRLCDIRKFHAYLPTKYRTSYVILTPVYADKRYLEYEVVIASNPIRLIFYLEEDIRIYGTLNNPSHCIIEYKGDRLKTIIVLGDKWYPCALNEDLRIRYRLHILFLSVGFLIYEMMLLAKYVVNI